MSKDIAQLLYGIKVNIASIEEGDRSPQLFEQVRRDCVEMLELMKLFLISQRDSYYGYFMMNLTYEVDFSAKCIAGILLGRFPPVFHTNPLLLCKFSLKEILFIVCHEIDHIVFNHPAEMLKTNPDNDPEAFEKFNLAADAAVNDRILQEIEKEKRLFLVAPGGHVSSRTLEKMFQLQGLPSMESYLYYFNLIREKSLDKQTQQPNAMLDAMQGGSGTGSETAAAPDGDGAEGGKDGGEGDGVITAQNCGKLEDHQWEAGEDEEEATAVVREVVNAATALMNEETRGLIPGSFFQQVEILNAPPKLNWQSILKKYVGTITADKRKTRMRLNRRQPERFDLSGHQDEKILKIVVAIDTSGSVSNEAVGSILREVMDIIAHRKNVLTVIECDSKIQRVYQVKSKGDIKKNVMGRGGTAFTPVVEYINDHREFRDALLIYFTDGYGEGSIPRPKTYRTLWVVLGAARHLSLEEPYGMVVTL